MSKKKLVVSYKNLSEELLGILKEKYPYGFVDHLIKVTKPNNEYFHAVTLDTEDASYLVKVDVKIDSIPKDDEDDDKDLYGEDDTFGTDSDDFPEDIADDDQSDSFDDDDE